MRNSFLKSIEVTRVDFEKTCKELVEKIAALARVIK
jgi:hypothetical protein